MDEQEAAVAPAPSLAAAGATPAGRKHKATQKRKVATPAHVAATAADSAAASSAILRPRRTQLTFDDEITLSDAVICNQDNSSLIVEPADRPRKAPRRALRNHDRERLRLPPTESPLVFKSGS